MAETKGVVNQSRPSPSIWNPNASVIWSVPFTPVFGAYLQMVNWKALGEPERARETKKWFYIGIFLLVFYLLVPIFARETKMSDSLSTGVAVLFLIAWYFIEGRAQSKFVKRKYASAYTRRSFVNPLLCAFGVYGAMAAIHALIEVVLGSLRGA